MLYALTPKTADGLKALLADGGAVGGRAASGAAARGVTWVKVTGAAVSGWCPGVVSLADGGAWQDLTDAVKVATDGGASLTTGVRYLCTRAGDEADGTPRFRTAATTGGALQSDTLTVVTNVACVSGSLVVTTTTYTLSADGLVIA